MSGRDETGVPICPIQPSICFRRGVLSLIGFKGSLSQLEIFVFFQWTAANGSNPHPFGAVCEFLLVEVFEAWSYEPSH